MSLELAARIAATSDCRMKVGAVLVKGGRILARGTNKMRNNPAYIVPWTECSEHAEESVLRQVRNARGTTIYVARVNRKGEWRLAKPCDRCQVALDLAGVTKVVYTDEGLPFGTNEGLPPLQFSRVS